MLPGALVRTEAIYQNSHNLSTASLGQDPK